MWLALNKPPGSYLGAHGKETAEPLEEDLACRTWLDEPHQQGRGKHWAAASEQNLTTHHLQVGIELPEDQKVNRSCLQGSSKSGL